MEFLSFKTKVARRYDTNIAIILFDFQHWDDINKKNQDQYHFKDGRYWIYYSYKSLSDHFEEALSPRKCQLALEKMVQEGLIVVSDKNYNKSKFDKTLWYSLTEKGINDGDEPIEQNVKSSSQIDNNDGLQNDIPIQQNVISNDTKDGYSIKQNVRPIPDNNNKYIINNKEVDKSTSKNKNQIDDDCQEIFDHYFEVSGYETKQDKTIVSNLKKILKEYSVSDIKLVIEWILQEQWYIDNAQTGLSVITRPTKFFDKLERAEQWQRLHEIDVVAQKASVRILKDCSVQLNVCGEWMHSPQITLDMAYESYNVVDDARENVHD